MFRRKNKVPPDPATAQGSAMRSLGRREHSAAQLKAKLGMRGYDKDTAGEAVDKLTEKGWQSDARYAELLVRSRVSQGYGPLRIKAELSVGGVPSADITAALEAVECDWADLAVQLHQRKFGAPPEGRDEFNKQYRYLMSRGFTGDQIKAALRREPEDE